MSEPSNKGEKWVHAQRVDPGQPYQPPQAHLKVAADSGARLIGWPEITFLALLLLVATLLYLRAIHDPGTAISPPTDPVVEASATNFDTGFNDSGFIDSGVTWEPPLEIMPKSFASHVQDFGEMGRGGLHVLNENDEVVFLSEGNATIDQNTTLRPIDSSSDESPYGLWGSLGTRTEVSSDELSPAPSE